MTNPDPPLSLANNLLVTTASNIGLTWSVGTNNGGTAVIDYQVWYDQSTGVWVLFDSGITTTSYTTGGLIAGNTYAFKLLSRNSFGFSTTYSIPISVLQA